MYISTYPKTKYAPKELSILQQCSQALFKSPGLHNERPCDRILEHARLSGSGAAQAFDPTCFLEVLEGEGALPPHFADEELPVAAQAAVIMHVPADGEAAAATGEEVGASGSKGSLSIIQGLGP